MKKVKNAMKKCKELDMVYRPGVVILVEKAGGPWYQPMVCGAVVKFPGGWCRKWCRTVAELEEFLRGKDERHELKIMGNQKMG